MKISVIMPSYLGHYDGAASNRPEKLHRAVCSFLNSIPGGERELVLVSDGCDETDEYWRKLARAYGSGSDIAIFNERVMLRHVRIEREGKFSGKPRNAGIEASSGDIIAYLDSDDVFSPDHLVSVEQNFADSEWVWFDDIVYPNRTRRCELKYAHIGTSCIAHRKSMKARWKNEYGHDWELVKDLLSESKNHRYIGTGGYIVCHVPNGVDE